MSLGRSLGLTDMSTFVLIHGGGGAAWDWHRVEPVLRALGHDVVAVDLPTPDPTAGLREYADAVIAAVGDRRHLVVAGHSFGGFTAALVAARLPVDALVYVTGMVPLPGEPPGDWWANTRHTQALLAAGGDPEMSDPIATFLHDVPPDLAAEALRRSRDQNGPPTDEPFPLDAQPAVPTGFVLCTDDRFFPPQWMRGVVRDRLGIEPEEIHTSHCPYLSRPKELAELLAAYGEA